MSDRPEETEAMKKQKAEKRKAKEKAKAKKGDEPSDEEESGDEGNLKNMGKIVEDSRAASAEVEVSPEVFKVVADWLDPVSFGVIGKSKRREIGQLVEAARKSYDPPTSKIVAAIHTQLKREATPGSLPLEVKAQRIGRVFSLIPKVPDDLEKAQEALDSLAKVHI